MDDEYDDEIYDDEDYEEEGCDAFAVGDRVLILNGEELHGTAGTIIKISVECALVFIVQPDVAEDPICLDFQTARKISSSDDEPVREQGWL